MNERHARPSTPSGHLAESSALRAVFLCCRNTTGLRLRLITCCPPDRLPVSMHCSTFLLAMRIKS